MYEVRSARRPAVRCPDFDGAYMTARTRVLRDRLRVTILRQTTEGALQPMWVLAPDAFGVNAREHPWQTGLTPA